MYNRSTSYLPDPADYETWYHTPRGAWIGDTEYRLLVKLLRPVQGSTLLDVGCGTGYFSRRFASDGLKVYGLDSDGSILAYAHSLSSNIQYLRGDATVLPFADHSIDYCTAITSLCFVEAPQIAIQEMLRVSRGGVAIGLLNREGLLYKQKHNRGAYRGARWDSQKDVANWISVIQGDFKAVYRTAVFFPNASRFARVAEIFLSPRWRWGSFLAVYIH